MNQRGRDEAGRPRLLIVDDEAGTREGLARVVAGWGYEVRAAASAEAALELVDEYRPEVVITDLVLPRMDGLQFLERMRQAPRPPVVLLISGHASVEVAVEAMRRGAADFLTKPVEIAQLQVRIEKAWLGAAAAPPRPEEVPVTSVREMERLLIGRALDAFDYDKPRAAATLGISLKTLYNKLAKYGIPLAKPERR